MDDARLQNCLYEMVKPTVKLKTVKTKSHWNVMVWVLNKISTSKYRAYSRK